MYQLSSNTTLFFKIFLPSIWLAFFSSFLIGLLLLDEGFIGGYPIIFFRVGFALFLLLGFTFFYFTVFKLKRIDANEEHVYVSSYFKNFRYPYVDVEKINIRDLGMFSIGTLTLKGEGSLGKEMTFLVSTRNLKKYLSIMPEKADLFEGISI